MQNIRANPSFLLLGSDPSIAELEFRLTAHWATELSVPNFLQKVLDFRRTDQFAFCPRGSWPGKSVVESCRTNLWATDIGNSDYPTLTKR